MAEAPPARWRLFVGAPVPLGVADELWRRLAPLREQHPAARWSPASKLHLTLVFLGPTDPADIPRIDATVARVTASWPPFVVETGEGGGFMGEGGGVAWLQLARGREDAAQLALSLDDALGARSYERRPPRPHLTLARRVTRPLLEEVHRVDTALRTAFELDRAVLFRSHSGPGSAEYEELSSFPLRES